MKTGSLKLVNPSFFNDHVFLLSHLKSTSKWSLLMLAEIEHFDIKISSYITLQNKSFLFVWILILMSSVVCSNLNRKQEKIMHPNPCIFLEFCDMVLQSDYYVNRTCCFIKCVSKVQRSGWRVPQTIHIKKIILEKSDIRNAEEGANNFNAYFLLLSLSF